MVGKALKTILASVNSGKLYPNKIPQTVEMPASVYQVIDDIPVNEKKNSAPVDEFRIQIATYAATYNEVATIQAAHRSALDNYRGTVSGVKIIIARFDDQRDLYDEKALAHYRVVDYIIRVKN